MGSYLVSFKYPIIAHLGTRKVSLTYLIPILNDARTNIKWKPVSIYRIASGGLRSNPSRRMAISLGDLRVGSIGTKWRDALMQDVCSVFEQVTFSMFKITS